MLVLVEMYLVLFLSSDLMSVRSRTKIESDSRRNTFCGADLDVYEQKDGYDKKASAHEVEKIILTETRLTHYGPRYAANRA